ncbi:MAG: hypothetical protein Q9168_003588 [Polycauliona sp. 1 TL-2023]
MVSPTASNLAGRKASVVSASGLASQDDAAVLAKLGYRQELRRNFTMIEVFGIAFSIMGLLPSIASTLAYSIPSGPAGMVWVKPHFRRAIVIHHSLWAPGLVPRFWLYLRRRTSHGISIESCAPDK